MSVITGNETGRRITPVYSLGEGFHRALPRKSTDDDLILPDWYAEASAPVPPMSPLYIGALTALVLIVLCAFVGVRYFRELEQKMEKSLEEAEASLAISFTNEPTVFEYGSEQIPAMRFVSDHTGEVSFEGSDVIDTSKVGLTQIVYRVSAVDSYDQTAQKEVVRNYFVQDTASPVIELKEDLVRIGAWDEFDPAANVLTVEDPADGKMDYAENAEKGKYTVVTDLDTHTAGDYLVTVLAQDKNGNTCEASYGVQVRYVYDYSGNVLNPVIGTINGPNGKETYYNLPMDLIVDIMRGMGFSEEEYPYWIRKDGVKMLGDYVMVAADLHIRPRGSTIETSLGTGLVCDTGGFALRNPTQIDIAVDW
ncbi:MAG: hypothetical protein IIY44_01860 [Erysipelotrichales bacterium]|nr:hypothetical protein [Erysipelotrichales bacterium]